jgi:hypothetical protein
MSSFKIPTNFKEYEALQRDTTKLLQGHIERFQERRLRAKGIEPSAISNGPTKRSTVGSLGDATKAEYVRTARRLLRKADIEQLNVWEVAAERATTKGVWYQSRAALQHVLIAEMRGYKKSLDEFSNRQKEGKVTKELEVATGRATKLLVWAANQLAAIPRGLPPSLKYDGKHKRPRHTKAHSLKGLPSDWREKIARRLSDERKLQWLTQCVTGMRPAELGKGVKIEFNNGLIELTVIGAKVRTGHAGQEWRRIAFDATEGLPGMLAELLNHESGVVGHDMNVKAYCNAISYHANEAFPDRPGKMRLSAYSARHAFKSDLKAAGKSLEEISSALGHRSSESQAYYCGTSSKGSGMLKPLEIDAANKVKVRRTFAEGRQASVKKANGHKVAASKTPKVKEAVSRMQMKPPGFD